MSPHGSLLLTAVLLAGVGKLLRPDWTLRIVGAVTVTLPFVVAILLREPPSPLGLAIVVPVAIIGATIGVSAGGLMHRIRQRRAGGS